MKRFSVVCASALLALFTLTGCGYDGFYRYPCQDPANWEKEECKPPVCTVNGACPEDLVDTGSTDGSTATVESGTNE